MSLRYLAFLILTGGLTVLIGYGTFNTARLLRTWQPDRNLLLLPGETVVRFLLLGLCVGLGFLSEAPLKSLGWTVAALDRQLLWGIGWGVVLAGVIHITTEWITAGSGERFYSPVVLKHLVPADRDEFLLVALAMAPVVLLEELLFRSLLLGGLAPLAPTLFLVLLGGLIFGLMHSPQGIWGMIGAALAGVIFGLLFLQAGSIVLPLVAHYVTNMLQLGLAMRTGLHVKRP